jgi:hypothetical protein
MLAGNDLTKVVAIESLVPALAKMTRITSLDLSCTCGFGDAHQAAGLQWVGVVVCICELLSEGRRCMQPIITTTRGRRR